LNLQEIENCIISIKPRMKAEYLAWLTRLILESKNLQDSKVNLQRKMELLKNDDSYNMASCPVWRAIQTQKCPTGENLVSFDKKTKVYKINNDEPITEAQREKLISLTGDLLK